MSAGVFHKIPRIDDSRLAEIFAREVLAMLVRKELMSPEWAERILSWPHSGFNVHSHIFIARVTSHIPDKGQVMVRYSGLYANARISSSWGPAQPPVRVPDLINLYSQPRADAPEGESALFLFSVGVSSFFTLKTVIMDS